MEHFIDHSNLGFQWDKGNTEKSKKKHNVEIRECEEVFFNQPLVLEDSVHSGQEKRFWALGITSTYRMLQVTYTIRNSLIRVISARDMSKKEKRIYEQTKKTA